MEKNNDEPFVSSLYIGDKSQASVLDIWVGRKDIETHRLFHFIGKTVYVELVSLKDPMHRAKDTPMLAQIVFRVRE